MGRGALLTFQLEFQEFEGGVVGAADEETIGDGLAVRRRDCVGGGARFHDLQILAAKFCVRSGPGLEAADAVEDFGGGAGKIDEAVFLFQDRGEGGLRVVLWARMNRCRLAGRAGSRP